MVKSNSQNYILLYWIQYNKMKGRRPTKGAGKKRVQRKRRQARRGKKYNSGDFARVQAVLLNEFPINSTGNGTAGSPSAPYGLYNFALTNSSRAVQVAQGYQEYRIARVDVELKPCADSFIAENVASGSSVSLPYLYYMIDKTGAFESNGTNSQTLKAAGAKPIRLDDKTIKISWKPAVQIGSSDTAGGPAPVLELAAAYKISPWLTTNANAATGSAVWAPNSVDHMGLVFAVEQPRGPFPTTVASMTVRITYEFRKPLWYIAPTPGVELQRVDLDNFEKPPAPLAITA